MFKIFFLLSLAASPFLSAETPVIDFSQNQKIAMQNSILAKVNGQTFSMMDVKKKMDLLFHILDTTQMDSVLVFSRTKHGADKISHRLERKGVKAIAIHSNRTQAQRDHALAGFKQGQFKRMSWCQPVRLL